MQVCHITTTSAHTQHLTCPGVTTLTIPSTDNDTANIGEGDLQHLQHLHQKWSSKGCRHRWEEVMLVELEATAGTAELASAFLPPYSYTRDLTQMKQVNTKYSGIVIPMNKEGN